MWLLHLHPIDEFAQVWNVEHEFIEECNFDIREMGGINSSHETVQVLASTSISEGERRENKAFPGRWVYSNVIGGTEEMKWKWLKLSHLGQGVRKCLRWEVRNHVKLKVYKFSGRIKKQRECGKDDPSQVEKRSELRKQ